MATISSIEEALIQRLRDGVPYLRTCGSLAEFLSRDLDAIEQATPLCPAAYAVYGEGKYSQKISGVTDREMVFGVIVVVKNLKGDAAVRHGTAGEKGIYDVLEDVFAALCGESCGLDIDPLEPVSEGAVTGTPELSVYEILFRTRCRLAC